MNIGKKIRELRIRYNLTQEDLAKKLCITPQAVSRWECGVSVPDISLIPLLSKTLFVTADELLEDETGNDPGGEVVFDASHMRFTTLNELQNCAETIEELYHLNDIQDLLNQNQIDRIYEDVDLVSDGTPKRVLVVDDSDFMRMMLTDILTKSGHTVLQAENGKLALKLLESDDPDICILDIIMPQMHGLDVLKQISSDKCDRKVIMLSALCKEPIVRMAHHLGARAFVAKPFHPESIIKRI